MGKTKSNERVERKMRETPTRGLDRVSQESEAVNRASEPTKQTSEPPRTGWLALRAWWLALKSSDWLLSLTDWIYEPPEKKNGRTNESPHSTGLRPLSPALA